MAIKDQQPLIICANHGNSFLDAILIALLFKRKLHFLARADVFNSSAKRWILKQFNMMPIYRLRDGRETLKYNDLIFDRCKQILNDGGAILIFPEGNCVVEKRIRAFKTGFAALAFEANTKNLGILPITLNYACPLAFYTDVEIIIHRPHSVEDFKLRYPDFQSFTKFISKQLTDDISSAMLMIPSREDDADYELIFSIFRNNGYKYLNTIVQKLEYLRSTHNIQYIGIKNKIKTYKDLLHTFQISDEPISQMNNLKNSWIFLAAPLYWIGWVLNYIPSKIIEFLISRFPKESQFIGAVRLVAGLLIYCIYLIVLIVVVSREIMFGGIYIIAIFYFYNSNFRYFENFYALKRVGSNAIQLQRYRTEIFHMLNP